MSETDITKEDEIWWTMMERKRKFDEELIMTVDEVLEESFGAAGPLIYTYLESRSVKREDIPERLEEFADCIKNFSAGGSIVEAMILRKLYSKFGLEFKQTSDHNSFADQIAKLRNSFHH